jgi:hypothetical protein
LSSASAPILVLRPKRSRLLILWWLGLHALLLGAAALVGWPWWCRALAMLAVGGHALGRWPATPGLLLVASDGSCSVPELGLHWLEPAPGTRLTAYWISLSLGKGRRRRDILLWVDQIDTTSWVRLTARLLRRGPVGTMPRETTQSADRTDLR